MNSSNNNYNSGGNPYDQTGRIDLNNYIPDPSKKDELKRRLYDSGISNIPMPSVKRPIEENISSKPFSAKMNPSKIQNTSPKKKEIEKLNKNIINNLKTSYEEAAVQEAKYKGEGTAEYYKSQHIMVPPPSVFNAVKPKGRLVPKMSSDPEASAITGLSSTNKILLNKGPKPGQLPALSDYGRGVGQSQMVDNMRLLQGPPALVMAGFEGGYSLGQKNLELARSKYLVDKLTGKLTEEMRGGMARKLSPLDGRATPGSHRSQMSRTSFMKLNATGTQNLEETTEEKKDLSQQKWSDLDKYIELLLDSKSEEETVFIYLNPNPNGDPYDLLCANYQTRNTQKYYTISGKGLTLYENDTPIEFISLGQWLIERDSYNHIKELDFFKKFKKWKFMRMWKKTIKQMARLRAANSLEDKLFMLQPHFSEHLAIHRKYMIEMQQQKFIDRCDTGDTKDMEEFGLAQKQRTDQIKDDIQRFSDKARENIRECISQVLSELRTRIVSEIALDEERKKNHPIQSSNTITMKRKASSNVFEKLGFPEGMTYGHRSSLRKECTRFLRFAYLVDFLSLEALANIYTGSVREMIERLKDLDISCDMEKVMSADYDESNQAGGVQRGSEPLFMVYVKLNDKEAIPNNEIQKVQIDDFVLPPRGTSEVHDFVPLSHLELEEEGAEAEESDGGEKEEEAAAIVPIYKDVVPNIQRYWLTMEPSADNYIEMLLKVFSTGLEEIKQFERWSKHNDLTPYAQVLEEWDDIVGDPFEEPDSMKLDPNMWIQEDPLFVDQKEMVSDIINSAFGKMDKFLTRFQPILEIYWRNKQIDLQILTNERLKNPIEGLQNTIKLFNHYNEMFSSQIPKTADIGLIQLDSSSARKVIQPTPKAFNQEIEKFVPVIIKERCDTCKKWLKQQIDYLKKPATNVDEFVEQNALLNAANEQFQNERDKVDMISQTYNVLKEFNMKVKKEDTDSFNQSLQQIAELQNLITTVEQAQEENKEKFKKQLAEQIPKLDGQINELFDLAQEDKFLKEDSLGDMYEMLKQLDALEERYNEHQKLAEKYNHQQEVMETQPTIFENLEDCREAISLRCTMWRSLNEWQDMMEKWVKTNFSEIDAGDIEKKADKYSKICLRLEKNLDPNPIQVLLKEKVLEFKDAMPIVVAFRNDKLQEQHWDEIKTLCDKQFDINGEDFTLKSLLELDLNQFKDEIVQISIKATQEAKLDEQLQQLQQWWGSQQTFTVEHDEKFDGGVLKEVDDIYTLLDESMAQINTILASRYVNVKPLRDRAETWQREILLLCDIIDQWLMCQRGCMYLSNIFKAPDISKNLPEETRLYQGVERFFKQKMVQATKTQQCIKWARPGVGGEKCKKEFVQNNETLDYVQKKLEDYMELKRTAFPRFYFLSNDELIDILANSTNLDVIQGHLKTCFDNIVKIEIDEDKEVVAMISNEKESVQLKKKVKTQKQQVENWLMSLQESMIDVLKDLMKRGNQDYLNTPDRSKFVIDHKGQIVATIAQIQWCQQSEEAIAGQSDDPISLQTWYDESVRQLEQLTNLVRGQLTDLQRRIIVALVTTDVHARDIIEELKEANVSSIADFRWVKQLKYYLEDETGECIIKQVSASLSYGYEYMGATSRLVITPLTDKCWITISNALHIKLGANPAGPAGTGKTESTKDLAKAIAIQCIVFNCSDQVNYQMMGRLFSGLCQQGCWTCLDEFNRIDIEVLSVIAQQLLSVRKGLLLNTPYDENFRFTFEDNEICLKPDFGCHVTMNPGYAGRTELPDNLKVMFRPVAMMIPNYGLIAEIMLFAEGFDDARTLSKKMVQLYKLSSEQLSSQDHYDFGLRAVKSVLVMAGALKRASPNDKEDGVLIRAMRDANVPKFLKDDLPLFSAIIQDLFPTAEIKENDYGKLKETIEQIIDQKDLQKTPVFVLKVIQLFETFNVRFGVMIVGPTGAGKSRCYEVLQETMTTLREQNDPNQVFQIVNTEILNPKAISMGEMYGEVDPVSLEWSDGLASKIMRSAAQRTDEERVWVVFDGPVDALWIENMNTVLDDNMTLCLANGQRIKLRAPMRMLFEVQDLAVASPATVSRCGMVYMTQEDLGWRPYVQTWINTFFQNEDLMSDVLKAHLWSIFAATIDPALEFIRTTFSNPEPIKTTDLQLVVSLCNFLEYFIAEEKGFKGAEEDKKKLLDCIFAFSYSWGLGSALDTKYKERFDAIVRDQFKSAQIPPSYTVYDYFFDLKKEKTFKAWATKTPAFVYDKEASYFDLMVPTTDTYKHAYCLEALLSIEKPIFFTGASGVGKSVVISNLLAQLKEKGTIVPININMSAQTTSEKTQQSIEEKLEKKKRTLFGATGGRKIAVFVDDINMPAVEEYGAQPPIELLRLLLDKRGLYVRGEWSWKDIEDTTIIACAAPPGGARATVTPRFSRRFNVFCLPDPSAGTLQTIFASILKEFLIAGNFQDKIKNLQEAAIQSTIEIYTRIQEDLRPTPAKFHYLFNLRDVSKVVQGICMVKNTQITTEEVFAKLWINETFRVFQDRLINEDDRSWYKDLIMELLAKNFKMSPDKEELFVTNKIMFGDLLQLDNPVQYYQCITDRNKLMKVLDGALMEYNDGSSSKMNLVLFEDAIEHIFRIARVLKQPRGHIMLIGVGGSGKQSLLKLCTFMRRMEYKTIEITKNFNLTQFQEKVKEYMKDAGINEKGISFVMTDTQIIDESFIENLNNLLNTGEIPNLMAPEDKDEITNGVRTICQKRKIVDSLDNINALFISLVRENLHICLCMSPVGDTLRVRCRQFPSLVNCCTLDWFSSWPEDALLYVSREFLKELPDVTEQVRDGLSEMCMRIHLSVEDVAEKFWQSLRRRVYTTPKSYLDLISLYLKVLEEKRTEFQQNKTRLATGLHKLNTTNSNIAELKVQIAEMLPELDKKNAELKVALVQVNRDKEAADEKEKVVSAEAEIVNKKAAEAQEIADDAEADLAAAKPELEAAQTAVRQLEKASIVEIKAFKQPPEGVEFVMKCVAILLGQTPDWASIKKTTLNDVNGFMDSLLNYDVEKTTEKTWKKARDGYITKPQFDPKAVQKISQSAASLCTWCIACSKFQIVTKNVAPKKKKLAEVTSVLNEAKAELQIKLDEVAKVKAAVAELEANCKKMQDEADELQRKMQQSSDRMRRAEKLVVLLADEGVRWKETVEVISGQIERLVGNVFLSCACISYFGAFTGQYREMLVDQWVAGCKEREIPTDEKFSLVDIMGDPVVMRNWGIAALPNDQVSLENGILTTQAERYALCIDPQQQANKWIKNMEKNNSLQLMKFGGTTFLRDIVSAVKIGRPVLIEDVEEKVDPSIDPILLKQQYKSDAGIMQIRLGDKLEDFDENFKFFMTTKMPNPHYIPEICIKVTLINFTVTFDGLEQQMLGDVVIAEKPEIEEKRDRNVLQMAADAATLKELENKILGLLSKATLEEILDEDTLINILDDSKKTSGEINVRMEQAKETEIEINDTRNLYKVVAVRGSILYFVIADLGRIDPMYQNSLAYVKSLFNKAIAESPQSETIEGRLAILIDNITRLIYTNISRGLFEKDKLIYSFLITTGILRNAEKIDEGIWNILLRGPTVFTAEEQAQMLKSPDVQMLNTMSWEILYSAQIRSGGQFEGLTNDIIDNWISWKEWAQTEDPYVSKLPGDWDEKLTNFDRLLLIKSFRNEMIQVSFTEFIIREMDKFYVESPSVAMEILYKQINTCTPLIFVLTQGADPTSILLKFAADMGFDQKLNAISLGQGQGPKAEKLIVNSMRDGEWVMLQNCHLARSWMPDLEQIVLGFQEKVGEIHEDFRLYLTSMPASYFPVSVLQNSVKLTTEPPRGMRANLKRSYQGINQEYLDDCQKPQEWRKLLFSLAFFHATIQERRKFGPLGWNIRYEFNDSDLQTSYTMLKLFLDSPEDIPWDALVFVTGHINYGGRVTDDNDRRCLITVLEKFCCIDALKDNYKFSGSGIYFSPPDGPIESYRDYIDSMPLNDNPEIFGLHENANINYQTQESIRIIETILGIQPRVATAAGGLTPDEIVLEKSKELLEQLPETLDKSTGQKELFVSNEMGLIPSLSTVLLQEMEKFNRLLRVIRRTLVDIDLAIKGFIVMSEELDSMYLRIQNNQVPLNWGKVAYPSLKPLSSWYKDLIKRVDFMDDWLKNGNPVGYWMPGMFFPQGFMTGVLQTHARQYKIAIDKLDWAFEILTAETAEELGDEKPEDGVYIYGLFMDGARWDRESTIINDQYPTIMFDSMPVIWFKPQEDYKPDPEEYQAPLYKTSVRAGVLSTTGQSTNYILSVSLPTKESPASWVQRAAALLCMLND